MRSKKKLVVCLFVSLLSVQTSAGPIERIIRMGDKSPIDAVLVPNDRYRFYQEQVDINGQITKDWQDCAKDLNRSDEKFGDAFLAGTITGSLVFLIISLAVKN